MDRKPAQTNDKPFIKVVSCINQKKKKKPWRWFFFVVVVVTNIVLSTDKYQNMWMANINSRYIRKYVSFFGNLISFCLRHPETHCITIFMWCVHSCTKRKWTELLSKRANEYLLAFRYKYDQMIFRCYWIQFLVLFNICKLTFNTFSNTL